MTALVELCMKSEGADNVTTMAVNQQYMDTKLPCPKECEDTFGVKAGIAADGPVGS